MLGSAHFSFEKGAEGLDLKGCRTYQSAQQLTQTAVESQLSLKNENIYLKNGKKAYFCIT